MPHDKKGRLVEVGDHIKFEVCETYDYERKAFNRRATVGRAVTVTPGSETCNVQAVHLVPSYWPVKTETVTAKETEVVLKADGSQPVDAPVSEAGRGRLATILATGLLALAGLVAPALAQTPAPSPGWVATLDAGASSIVTTAQRHEYVTSRFTLAGPLGEHLRLALAAEARGDQDGGALGLRAPRSFRDIVPSAELTYSAGPLDITASGSSTFSIEGRIGAPLDPRQFEGVVLVGVPLRKGGGSVAAGGGHVGAVGGYGLVLRSKVPIGPKGLSTVVDYLLPWKSDAFGRRDWVMRVGGRVAVGSFGIGGLIGR